MDVVDTEDPVQLPYYGLKNTRPLTTYTPFKDLNVGYFVLVRPHNPNLIPLWMGKAEGDVIKDEESEYFQMVKVQQWVLVKKG
jgi:hypothetical protein